MSTTTDKQQDTKVITGLVRFSYLKVFKPEAVNDGDEKKYSANLIIPKSDKAMVAKINKAIQAAITAGIAGKWNGKKPANLKTPLRDGDEERPDSPEYADSWFIGANSKTKPGLVDKNLQDIIDPDDIKSGDYGKASINFYPYEAKGNKGIAAGLNHLQKIKDGEALSGRGSAADDFEEENEDDYSFLD